MTLAKLRDQHQREERRLILDALKRHQWRVSQAALFLDVPGRTLRMLIVQHDLAGQVAGHSPGPGRPRKSKASQRVM